MSFRPFCQCGPWTLSLNRVSLAHLCALIAGCARQQGANAASPAPGAGTCWILSHDAQNSSLLRGLWGETTVRIQLLQEPAPGRPRYSDLRLLGSVGALGTTTAEAEWQPQGSDSLVLVWHAGAATIVARARMSADAIAGDLFEGAFPGGVDRRIGHVTGASVPCPGGDAPKRG